MTPEQFAERMRGIAAEHDTEWKHARADDLMCELLTQLGYGEGVNHFVLMEKWYA